MPLTLRPYKPPSTSWAFLSIVVPIMTIVFLFDQVTKYWAESTLCPFNSFPAQGSFKFVCTYNTGSAFGMFQDQTIPLIFASFAGIGLLLWIYKTHLIQGPWLHLSMGLQLGGAIGNLTDRLRFGHVTDFIQLAFWPVFNLADASIVVGVILLVAVFLLPSRFGVTDRSAIQSDGMLNDSISTEENTKTTTEPISAVTIEVPTSDDRESKHSDPNGN